ncbi:hypothetical protein GCM10023318_05480 [Nocardia callitridis]|uniref:Carrier domain-containing protein n=2 Tax=Nocardia callitridis TaxID=648753 RepID=A0ABP9JW49_9NOCA
MLSHGQRRAWFLQSRDPADVTLNHGVAYRISGDLDTERLRGAVTTVIARHEILRTTYDLASDGDPRQLVADDTAPAWQEYDLTELAEGSRARRLEVLARRELARPFRLNAETPLRFTLVHTGAGEFVFLMVVHTICWDEHSSVLFGDELAAAYRGGLALSSDSPAQFHEVASLVDEPDEAAVEYWRRAVRPLPELLELPGAPVSAPARTERCVRELPSPLVDRVRAFAAAQAGTPMSVLLSAFQAVIHRYTGAVDFLVAVPVSTRAPESDSVIGYFGNTLLVRARVRPNDSFATFAATVAESWHDAFAHRSVGIDRVVHEVNPHRFAGRDGLEQLVRVGFAVRDEPHGRTLSDGAITAEPIELGGPASAVALTLTVVTGARGTRLEAKYRGDRLDDRLVERLLAHYERLLTHALSGSDCRIGDLDLFDAEERARIMGRSHGELVDTPPTTLTALLQQRATDAPDAVAILVPAGTEAGADLAVTYGQLHRRANRLARWLIGCGIGTEDLVALRLDNSLEFVVAVLAVLKSGAAYLPVDPNDPHERRRELDRDAEPTLLFDPDTLAAAEHAARTLSDTYLADEERVRPLRPGNLAYVIYTSGSTGRPKGVQVAHAAIAEHVLGFGVEGGILASDTLVQSVPVGFDAALLDLFVTLTVGARLVIPKPGAFGDLRYVADLVARLGVTVLHMVPSTLSTLLLLPEVSEWRRLRYVPVGGEALLGELADRFARTFDAELRNYYGPTEAVVAATHRIVEGPQGAGVVSIGVPNRNVCVYLLDARLHPVADGVIGEIYVGGNQVARGYLNRRGLSAHSFVADPFGRGQRLYRTGDLARRCADGGLEFIGRADDQVKVRGYRVELGEVRSVLSGHPGVADVAVIAVDDAAVGTMLAAYLVPTGTGEPTDLDGVRAHAAKLLPEYMRPSAYSVLDRIPLTGNGKLDRAALPAPVRGPASTFREPATEVEARIAERFEEILGVAVVGAQDSFFELGGHSLLANRLLPWIQDEFGVELDVRAVFDAPTVADLATLVEATPVLTRATMTADERERLLGEWSSGVELSEVSAVDVLVRRGRTVPGIRPAVRCGGDSLTYGRLFAAFDDFCGEMFPRKGFGSTVAGASAAEAALGDAVVRATGARRRSGGGLRDRATRCLEAGASRQRGSGAEDSASLEGVVALLARLGGPGRDRAGLAQTVAEAALTAAVADRRAVAAECRGGCVDPALGSADVRLIAAPWGDRGVAVELFAALADGATLLIATAAELADPALLADLMRTHAVTHLVADPDTAAAVARAAGEGAALAAVRRWDLTGRRPAAGLADRLLAVSPESVSTIAYTPPAYLGPVARGPLDGTARTRPIPGARVLVLDADRQPVTPGVVGDIYVGGAALHPHPEAPTDSRITDPVIADTQLHRTGDRAWWTPDGWLILLDSIEEAD